MAYTYAELSKMTVAALREIAIGTGREELKGVTIMHKEQLLPLLCHTLGVEIPHHHAVGGNKTILKQKIRKLKVDRDAAAEKHDTETLTRIRHEIHDLKRKLRRMMV